MSLIRKIIKCLTEEVISLIDDLFCRETRFICVQSFRSAIFLFENYKVGMMIFSIHLSLDYYREGSEKHGERSTC